MLLYYGFAHEAMLEVPGLPLSPSVIDRQLNPTAKGNNIKMQLIAFSLLQAFLPHVWRIPKITLHV